MRAVVPIEHEGVRGLIAVGIIAEAIDRRVPDQLLVLIIAASNARDRGSLAQRSWTRSTSDRSAASVATLIRRPTHPRAGRR
jgi:hypothetical protein